MKLIKSNLKVFDSESHNLYKSKHRAECLERMLFVCPNCKKTNTIYSKNEFVYCNNCNLKVEYCEDLSLKSYNESCNFTKLIQWYDFQKDWCRSSNYQKDDIIFEDNVKFYRSEVNTPRTLLFEGKMTLTANNLIFGDYKTIPLNELIIASPISGKKFNFSTLKENYLVVGNDRFNPLKYILMFNKLDTYMKEKKIDIYFSLDD